MLPEEAFNELFEFSKLENINVTPAFVAFKKEESKLELRRLFIGKILEKDFFKILQNKIKELEELKKSGDLRIYEFSLGYKPEYFEIEYLKLDGVLEEIIKSIPEPIDIPLFDRKEDFTKKLRFYTFIFEDDDNKLYCFRRKSENQLLVKSNNLLVRLIGNRYEKFSEYLLQFDNEIDVIVYKNYIFILNKRNFQHIFRFHALLKSEAEKALSQINSILPIINFEDFRQSCLRHIIKMEKLKNISNKPYLENLNIKNIRNIINEFNLKLEIKTINGSENIVFDKTDGWTLLNVLDDSYLGSDMTGIKYEANSKHELSEK